MRIVILFAIFLLSQAPLRAQDVPVADETQSYEGEEGGEGEAAPHALVDPGELETTRSYRDKRLIRRPFDEAKWKQVVGDTDYREAMRQNDPSLPAMPWAGAVLKVISYLVVITVVGWLLYYLFSHITFGLRIERTPVQADDPGKHVEEIEYLDIEALLAQARREGNLRLAIRLYYLRLLKKLDAIGMIRWKKDKTNRDYLSELFLKDFYYKDIQRLTILYETVWYGEHTLRGESFERLTREFEKVYVSINAAKSP